MKRTLTTILAAGAIATGLVACGGSNNQAASACHQVAQSQIAWAQNVMSVTPDQSPHDLAAAAFDVATLKRGLNCPGGLDAWSQR